MDTVDTAGTEVAAVHIVGTAGTAKVGDRESVAWDTGVVVVGVVGADSVAAA